MRHYHGTPIGGTRVGTVQFARRRFLFVPWKRPEDLSVAQEVTCGYACDNSAFSFWRTSEKPEWKMYAKWIEEMATHPKFDFAIIPDVIDGTLEDNQALLGKWWRWLPYRVADSGVPVWHLHEPIAWLTELVKKHRMIALGSSGEYSTPGVGRWWDRMDEAFDAICDEDGRPKCRVHGLRMLRDDIVAAYPFASCDSTNVTQNSTRTARNNGLLDKVAAMELHAQKIEQVQSPAKCIRKPEVIGLF